MAAVRFSIVAVLRAIRLCVDDRFDADSSVVRCCNFCGTHAGIDPASSAVVELEASVKIYLSLSLSRSRSQFDDNTFRVL